MRTTSALVLVSALGVDGKVTENDIVAQKVNITSGSQTPLISAWRDNCAFATWLVERMGASVTVDLGVDWGFSSFCFAAAEHGIVYSVDVFAKAHCSQVYRWRARSPHCSVSSDKLHA